MEDAPETTKQIAIKLPKAPAFSNTYKKNGNTTNLITNMFPIKYTGKDDIYIYSIEIEPEIAKDSRILRERIVRSIYKELNTVFIEKDDIRLIQGFNMFSFYSKGSKQSPLIYETRPINNVQYNVTIRQVNCVKFKDLDNLGQGNATTMILNSYIKNIFKKMKMIEIGKNAKYYNPNEMWSQKVSGIHQNDIQLYVWKGFKTSSYLCPDSQYLQIDFSSRVLRDETVQDFINYHGKDKSNQLLPGRSVMADYGNNTMYRVEEIMWEMSPLSTFQLTRSQDTRTVTFKQYYQDQYGKKIKIMDQPLLLHRDKRTKNEIYLIPELCLMTGIEENERANFNVMKAISQYTKLTPLQRMHEIESMAQKIDKQDDKVFEFTQKGNPTCEGFVLNAPKIHLGQQTIDPQSGNFRLQQQIFEPHKFQDWVFVYQSKGKQDDQEADAVVNDMKTASKAFGITIKDPGFLIVKGREAKQYIDVIEEDIQKNGPPEFVVTYIDRSQKSSLYTKLKDYFYVQKGIPHSNMVRQSLVKNRMSVLSNILCQMNAKLNKPLWRVDAPTYMPNNCMLIGIDFFHKRIAKKQSCVGFVASMNQDINQYYSRICITNEGELFVKQLNVLVNDACLQYHKANKKLPETIIIYRDGVGDSQIESVLQQEVAEVKKGFAKLNPEYNPEFSYILVNKKCSTKFFSQEDVKGAGRGGKGRVAGTYNNPQSGTIVCKQIVSQNFDFFLAAQNVNSQQGTCTPTHYTVIHNDTTLPQDFFHQLTYFQTFNYFNWPGAVRVPACVMYAKKLSYLVGETFKDDVHDKLDDKLYYL